MSTSKYKMTIDLNILNHLGLNLYSNVAAVLSEAVANAWDADASSVDINLFSDKIEIIDSGFGMTEDDINNKYLRVGRKKRETGDHITPNGRAVMGRKGIGKLSLFSIAKEIQIESVKDGEKSALLMRTDDIEEQVVTNRGDYYPIDLGAEAVTIATGTKITLRQLKKNVENTESQLRKKLARRFSIIGLKNDFIVRVDSVEVTIADRDFYKSLEYVWPINNTGDDFTVDNCPNLLGNKPIIEVAPAGTDADKVISGWIGAVQNTSQLSVNKAQGITDNKIVLLSRGKLVQENVLEGFNIGSIYAKYLIGEINADFLDTDDKDDISTSNRQTLIEDDPRYLYLLNHIYTILKKIQKDWEGWRSSKATDKAIEEFPMLDEWYQHLKINIRPHAQQLFSTIQNIHFDEEGNEKEKRKELYKQGILAFERLRVKENLAALSAITSAADLKFAGIFSDVNEIEALLYHDIASQRVAVIRELSRILDDNEKEKVIQKYLFDNLWLLNPSWERATHGSARMEQQIANEFEKVDKTLLPVELAGRFDIKYRTSAGKHIIIELKRFQPGYIITPGILIDQINKYIKALKICLKAYGRENEPIEVVCILGKTLPDDRETLDNTLKAFNARIKYYDELIEESLAGYQEFLEKNTQVNRIKQVIDSL